MLFVIGRALLCIAFDLRPDSLQSGSIIPTRAGSSDVETEVDDVAVLNDVFLSFQAQAAG